MAKIKPQNVNFIATDTKKSIVIPFSWLVWFGVGLVLLLMFISFSLAFSQIDLYWHIKKLNTEHTQVMHAYSHTAHQNPLLASNVPLIQQNEQIRNTLLNKQSELEALTHTALRKGFSTYLSEIAQSTPDGMWLDSFSIDQQNKIYLFTGSLEKPNALSLFIRNLYQSPLFAGQSFESIIISSAEDKAIRQFKITNQGGISPNKTKDKK